MRRLVACALAAAGLLAAVGPAHAAPQTVLHWTALQRWNVLVVMETSASESAIAQVLEEARDATSPYVQIAPMSVDDQRLEADLRVGRPDPGFAAATSIVRVSVPIEVKVPGVVRKLQRLEGVSEVRSGKFADQLLIVCAQMWPFFDAGAVGVTVRYDATPAQVDELRAFLGSSPLVAAYVYFDPPAAHAALVEKYPTNAEVPVENFNAQVRVTPVDASTGDELAAVLKARFAVAEALTWISSYPPGTCGRLAFVSP